jgi:hypothetical protein
MAAAPDALYFISAHWDTRPLADRDGGADAGRVFLGANDGASGVAVALGIARAAKATPLARRLVFIFHDAEDSGVEGKNETWCLGARFSAENLPPWFKRVRLGINLDMVGGKELRLAWEGYSLESDEHAVKRLWRLGAALAPRHFLDGPGGRYIDDHLPYIRKNIRVINLIGLPYPFWHRAGDRPEALDPRAMGRVGEVLLEFLKREMQSGG